MLLHINGQFTMIFLSIVSHSIHAHSLISRSTCPLNFLKYSSSFYPRILPHSSRTCPFIIFKHTRSFYQQYFSHIVAVSFIGGGNAMSECVKKKKLPMNWVHWVGNISCIIMKLTWIDFTVEDY